MKRDEERLLSISGARAIATLLDLHRQAHAEWTGLARAFAGQALRLWRGCPVLWTRLAPRLQQRNGFCSARMPMRLGGELSVKVAV